MRVASSTLYQQGLASMNLQQGSLLHIQQQLGTGRRVLTPSDDPVTATRALGVSQAQAVNGQYAIAALSDPFSRGWNLLGTADIHVDAGIVMGAGAAWLTWNSQAFAIVAGHMIAVLVAHRLAFRLHETSRAAVLGQLPLAALMVGYTVLGLWLLSTPTVG